jgi:hypothetical protein
MAFFFNNMKEFDRKNIHEHLYKQDIQYAHNKRLVQTSKNPKSLMESFDLHKLVNPDGQLILKMILSRSAKEFN